MKNYQFLEPIGRNQAEKAFESGDPVRICDVLVSITYHEKDWPWVQEKCLQFCQNTNHDVKALAINCLGHISRIHGSLDLELVLPVLQQLLLDKNFEGVAKNALEDIEIFSSKRN